MWRCDVEAHLPIWPFLLLWVKGPKVPHDAAVSVMPSVGGIIHSPCLSCLPCPATHCCVCKIPRNPHPTEPPLFPVHALTLQSFSKSGPLV